MLLTGQHVIDGINSSCRPSEDYAIHRTCAVRRGAILGELSATTQCASFSLKILFQPHDL